MQPTGLTRFVLAWLVTPGWIMTSCGCLPAVVCGPGAGDDVNVRSCADGDVILRFTRQKSYGFCPSPTGLFSASIVADETGKHTFCATELVEAPFWCPNCVEKYPDRTPCIVELPLPQKILTDQQVQRLEELLTAVPQRSCSDDPIAVDRCIVSVYEFFGRREQAVCSFGEVNDDFRLAIQEVESFLYKALAGP